MLEQDAGEVMSNDMGKLKPKTIGDLALTTNPPRVVREGYVAQSGTPCLPDWMTSLPEVKVELADKHKVDSATGFLDEAVSTLKARAVQRDAGEQGERSMSRAVNIFNAWTGGSMKTEDGWRFMIALKQAREIQGQYNRDDYVDLSAYSSLLGEEMSRK